jgi:predicted ribosomally synthesized peptide with SipW-like signal peptide
MKAFLVSVIVIALMGGLVGVGLFAYFSDTETSTGNTFTAGEVDLVLDRDGLHYNGTNCRLFEVSGLKPGDTVEETLSLHVAENSNPGILERMTLTVVEDSDNDGGINPPMPELEDYCDNGLDGDDGTADGDLDTYLDVKLWWDDGDNIHQPGEPVIWQGMASDITAASPFTIDLDFPMAVFPAEYYMGWELHFVNGPGDEYIAMTDKWVVDAVFELKQIIPGP